MRFLSVCSGIEAASVAWRGLDMECIGVSDIDAFPSAVLAHHYPETPNHGDLNGFREWNVSPFDLLVGGTPCQAFSVAGLRKGLDDPRGNLTLTYLALAARYRPRWVLWENVPGVISDKTGAFASFLTGLGELGYGFAYRILNALHFGVPQRRRRVFVVGCLGGWPCAAAVLFEPASLCRDIKASRSKGPNVAALSANGVGTCGADDNQAQTGHLIAHPSVFDPSLENLIAHSLRAEGFDASEDGTGRGTPLVPVGFNARQDPDVWPDRTGPLDTDGSTQAVAFAENSRQELREMDVAGSLKTGGGKPGQSYPAIRQGLAVRRLTPRECERLQGFPDDYTLIDYKGKPASDGPRYKALGNSMAVPVMRWIGQRMVDMDSFL